MRCLEISVLAVIVVIAIWLRTAIQGWSWDARHEPRWSRRLGERWKRTFPSREEREARRRGFEVEPKREGSDARQIDDPSGPPAPPV
jgi:hypothetical protein